MQDRQYVKKKEYIKSIVGQGLSSYGFSEIYEISITTHTQHLSLCDFRSTIYAVLHSIYLQNKLINQEFSSSSTYANV